MTTKQAITEYKKNIKVAEVFAAKHDAKLPDGLGTLSIYGKSITYTVMLEHVSANDHTKVLLLLGDVFDRTEWVAEAAYNNLGFHWTKIVDGVEIRIYHAQKINMPQSFPVEPKQFPLQLRD